MKIKDKLSAWLRAFKIWQKTGNGIWVNTRTERERKRQGIFHGAFDSIPFLNDDAKRTFIHLVLRPGYMIRDYISGKHDIYMAPIASLIIFYSFFTMVSAVVNPDSDDSTQENVFSVNLDLESDDSDDGDDAVIRAWGKRIVETLSHGYQLLHLDKNPDEVDTRWKASLAAFEATMRNQGVTMFIGELLLLWMAVFVGLRRKYGVRLAAAASMAGYMLCQVCFLRMFTMLFTFGRSLDAGVLLTMLVLMIDYHQILGVSYKRSFLLTIKTGLLYAACLMVVILLLLAVVAIAVK
ncbi:MAG: DUF3667 domain-containing protein [Salinivirgaceae bacterium]|nr:DUF3667 domain-containing protein [Salinivirgaceae bacterium]